jgi:hypothetical protein
MFAVFANEPLKRTDQMVFKACALADHGEWDEASRLFRSLAPVESWSEAFPIDQRQALQQGSAEWLSRMLQRCASMGIENEDGLDELSRGFDQSLEFSNWIGESQEIKTSIYNNSLGAMREDLCRRAAAYRKSGRLDLADRTRALLNALASRLAEKFPGTSWPHVFLSEAYVQESKNAWARNDMKAIKSGIERAIQELNLALPLDPNNAQIRKSLKVYQDRLAALPKS